MNLSRRYTHILGVIDRLSRKYLVCIGLLFATKVAAQGAKPAVPNVIQQDTALYGFFALLEQADSTVVNVLHLGDSHIQAGFLPVTTGAALQKEFGNAGRGWVFPYN